MAKRDRNVLFYCCLCTHSKFYWIVIQKYNKVHREIKQIYIWPGSTHSYGQYSCMVDSSMDQMSLRKYTAQNRNMHIHTGIILLSLKVISFGWSMINICVCVCVWFYKDIRAIVSFCKPWGRSCQSFMSIVGMQWYNFT